MEADEEMERTEEGQREREWRNGKDRNGMKRYNTSDI